jgi:hypothetical protein
MFKTKTILRRLQQHIGRLAMPAACAMLANAALGATSGFTVTQNVSGGAAINSLARADNLHAGIIASSSSSTGDYSVVNFRAPDESTRLHFADAADFPIAEPRHDHNFAMHVSGEVDIPRAGEYSFGVTGNGGFALNVGGETMHRYASSGGSTKIETMDFTSAGTYSVDLTYYEHAGHASLELFASEGKYRRFHARGADFQLVGDSANGGLGFAASLDSAPSSDLLHASDLTAPGTVTPPMFRCRNPAAFFWASWLHPGF